MIEVHSRPLSANENKANIYSQYSIKQGRVNWCKSVPYQLDCITTALATHTHTHRLAHRCGSTGIELCTKNQDIFVGRVMHF